MRVGDYYERCFGSSKACLANFMLMELMLNFLEC